MAVQVIPHLRFELQERGRKRPLKQGLIPATDRRIFAGAGADNHIAVVAPGVPKKFLLVEPKDKDRFYFYFTDQMEGLVVRDGLPLSLDEIVSKGVAEKSDGAYRVELEIGDEAKLKWGDKELWLKLVVPFPRELKRRVEWSFELPFLAAVAFSLMLHGLLIAYFNTRPVGEGIAIRPPTEVVAEIPSGQIEIPPELMPEESEVKPSEQKAAEEKKGGEKKGAGGPGTGKGPAQRGLLAVLTSKGKSGVIKDILTSGFEEDIVSALGSVSGVQVARSDVSGTRGGGGDGGGGARTVDIGGLGTWGPQEGRELEEIKEHKVEGGVKASAPEVLGKLDRNVISSVVMRYIGGIRACYEQKLKINPQLSGKISVRFTIGVDGRVVSREILRSTLNDPDVENCILRRIRYWRFPPPEEGEVVVTYPFVLTAVSE